MHALDGHALGGPGVPRRFYLVSGFSQRTLQEALNFDFIFHQQKPHDLMLMHSSGVLSQMHGRSCSVCGFATPLGEVAFRLVTVAVVIDVTRRLGLRLRT
jgi:hypothetical protein